MILSEVQSNQRAENNYVVLARRTRPQNFSELIGQDVVSKSITNMLNSQKIPHAFLFTGTRGTGKTSSARILAKSLCCEKGPTPFPCQVCVHCVQITACGHDDILEIDGASNTGVDHVRELNEAARFYPRSAKFKIFIIDEVHMLSTGAFNALLKTLEEPPKQVVFILATTELHKVPITVRSRCMIFSFKKIETPLIANHLKNILIQENINFEEDALQIIAREAKGSLRDSLSLLEQVIAICDSKTITLQNTKSGLCVQGEEIAENLFSAICDKNTTQIFQLMYEANLQNLDVSILIENTAALFRSAILVKNFSDKEKALRLTQLLSKEYDYLFEKSSHMSSVALSEIFKTLSQAVKDISRSSAPYSWAEIVVVDCILKSEWMSSTEIIQMLNQNSPLEKSPLEKDTKVENQKINLIEKPKESMNLIDSSPNTHNPKVDFNLFKKFLDCAKLKSEILATKLKFVKLNSFNLSEIDFADTNENATYLEFNDQDKAFFWGSIKEAGLDRIQIRGKYLPSKPTREKNIVENFQKFSRQTISNNQNSVAKTISLNDVVTDEKIKAGIERTNQILAKENMQTLRKFATEIKVTELNTEN